MKSYLKLTLAVIVALSLSACDSNKNSDEDNLGGSGKMTASIDGSTWNAANATATKVSVLGTTSIIIAGADADAAAMTISFIDVTAAGTFVLGGNNLIGMSFIQDASGTTFIATSGSATVTTINGDKVKGTFAFEGQIVGSGQTVSITNGTFDVGYGISPF